jgi:hypothetical protein
MRTDNHTSFGTVPTENICCSQASQCAITNTINAVYGKSRHLHGTHKKHAYTVDTKQIFKAKAGCTNTRTYNTALKGKISH